MFQRAKLYALGKVIGTLDLSEPVVEAHITSTAYVYSSSIHPHLKELGLVLVVLLPRDVLYCTLYSVVCIHTLLESLFEYWCIKYMYSTHLQ